MKAFVYEELVNQVFGAFPSTADVIEDVASKEGILREKTCLNESEKNEECTSSDVDVEIKNGEENCEGCETQQNDVTVEALPSEESDENEPPSVVDPEKKYWSQNTFQDGEEELTVNNHPVQDTRAERESVSLSPLRAEPKDQRTSRKRESDIVKPLSTEVT